MIVVRTLVDQQLTTGKVIIVDDPINEEGVNYLIERATPTLLTLILSTFTYHLEGAFSGSAALLSFHRGVFNNLVIVELSTFASMQKTTKSTIKDVSIYRNAHSIACENSA